MRLLLMGFLLAACASVDRAAPVTVAGPVASCRQLEVAVAAPDSPALDLVVAVNGIDCHREPLWAGPVRFASALGAECDRAIEPGANQVVVRLVARRVCGKPVAEARHVCEGPEPD